MPTYDNNIPVTTKDFSILMGTLNQAVYLLSNGRHENPHCTAYGIVTVVNCADGGPAESYYILFNPTTPGFFKLERFENKNNLESGCMVYFYDDKAEAIVQSTLRGEGDNFLEIE